MPKYVELPGDIVSASMPGIIDPVKFRVVTSDGTCTGCAADLRGISICFALPPCHTDNRTDDRHVIFVEVTDEQ